MNREIATDWANDLRTEGILQGRGYLRQGERYCCLGRLCNLYQTATGKGKWVPQGTSAVYKFVIGEEELSDYYDDQTLPHLVQDWAEMQAPNGRWDLFHALSHENDNGASFPTIADLIEAHVEEL